MLDASKLSMQQKLDIARNLGWIDMMDDSAPSSEIDPKIEKLTPSQAFDAWCNWNGLIGWANVLEHNLDRFREAAK